MNEVFNKAIKNVMLWEVGPWFDESLPVHKQRDVKTSAERKATGYVNDPVDHGGLTKYGIAQNANPLVNVSTLTYEEAKNIYFNKYWTAVKADSIPFPLNVLVFDVAVNSGPGNAIKFLQRALEVTADGVFGPGTLAALRKSTSVKILCERYNDQRKRFFNAIVARNPSQGKFLAGWMRRVEWYDAWFKKNL